MIQLRFVHSNIVRIHQKSYFPSFAISLLEDVQQQVHKDAPYTKLFPESAFGKVSHSGSKLNMLNSTVFPVEKLFVFIYAYELNSNY